MEERGGTPDTVEEAPSGGRGGKKGGGPVQVASTKCVKIKREAGAGGLSHLCRGETGMERGKGRKRQCDRSVARERRETKKLWPTVVPGMAFNKMNS